MIRADLSGLTEMKPKGEKKLNFKIMITLL
jgi:hypothetical protein